MTDSAPASGAVDSAVQQGEDGAEHVDIADSGLFPGDEAGSCSGSDDATQDASGKTIVPLTTRESSDESQSPTDSNPVAVDVDLGAEDEENASPTTPNMGEPAAAQDEDSGGDAEAFVPNAQVTVSAPSSTAATSAGSGLSQTSPLERAIIRYLADQDGGPVLLSHLAANTHLRNLAHMRGVELRKPYFQRHSNLFVTTQEDQYNTYISLARTVPTQAKAALKTTTSPNAAAAIPQSKETLGTNNTLASVSQAAGDLIVSTSPGKGAESPARQKALSDLEKQVVAFIETSEQPVVLCRFAAHSTLKKLAKAASVELKKGFFSERPQLFRIQEETSGNARIWLASGCPQDVAQAHLEKESLQGTQPGKQTPSTDQSETASPPASPEVQANDTPLTMVDAGMLFVHKQGKAEIPLNMFGLDPALSKLASAEGSTWRRPFFNENDKFFSYNVVRSAASIALTERGRKRAERLAGSNVHAQQYMKRGVLPTSAQHAISSAQLLEKKVVEFIQAEVDDTVYLHTIAADQELKKLAVAAELVLRKPYFEGRPHLFRLLYPSESTVMVTLARGRPATAQPGVSAVDPKPPQRPAPGDDAGLWIQLQKEIDRYFLDGTQRYYLLATVGQQPVIKKIALQLNIRVGKEYFLDRSKQYVIQLPDSARNMKAITVGFTPSYYHSLKRMDGLSKFPSPGSRDPLPSSSPSARLGLAFAPDPTMRRIETVAVECILRSQGHSVPLHLLAKDRSLDVAKVRAVVSEAFFRQRPHLFSCTTTESGVLCIGLAQETKYFSPLETAFVNALNRSHGYKSELGSLICEQRLERMVASFTTADIRIAKAFFMARPHMFSVTQIGSRAEVDLLEKHRVKHATKPQQEAVQPKEEEDEGNATPTITTRDNTNQVTTEQGTETGLDDEEMAAWEEELSGGQFVDADAEEDEEEDDEEEEEEEEEDSARSATLAMSDVTSQPAHPYPRGNPAMADTTTGASDDGFAAVASRSPGAGAVPLLGEDRQPTFAGARANVQQPWDRLAYQQHGHGHQAAAADAPSAYRYHQVQQWPAQVPGMGDQREQHYDHYDHHHHHHHHRQEQGNSMGIGRAAGPAGTNASAAPAVGPPTTSYPPHISYLHQAQDYSQPQTYIPPGTSGFGPRMPAAVRNPLQGFPAEAHETRPHQGAATGHAVLPSNSGNDISPTPLTEQQLEEAEERLVALAPSLAYALRRKRSGGITERMADSMQLPRLRSELLQLQILTKLTLLCIEEEYCGAAQVSEMYIIRIKIHEQCYGEARGSWKLARVEALIDAAARLSLEIQNV